MRSPAGQYRVSFGEPAERRPERPRHRRSAAPAAYLAVLLAALTIGIDWGSWFGTPTAAVSEDGRLVVFTARGWGGSDLYLLEVGSRRVSRLTWSLAYEETPAFSPDGRLLAWSARYGDGGGRLWVRNLVTRSTRPLLTSENGSDRLPVFTPTGTRVYFAHERQRRGRDLGWDVWRVGLGGFGLRRVTFDDYRRIERLTRDEAGRGFSYLADSGLEDGKVGAVPYHIDPSDEVLPMTAQPGASAELVTASVGNDVWRVAIAPGPTAERPQVLWRECRGFGCAVSSRILAWDRQGRVGLLD